MSRLSIRLKLLIVFMSLFTVVFATSFYWFYHFATELAMDNLRQSLITSAQTAANLINVDNHTQLFVSGEEGDATYTAIANQLRLVQKANFRAEAIYTMVRSTAPNELLFVVSADENPETRAHLREPYDVNGMPEMLAAFENPIADQEMGADEFGVWLSGYAPVRDAQGKGVAIVGVDMTAAQVIQVQNQVKTASLLVFGLAYASVFLAIILISRALTRPLCSLTAAALTLEEGKPFDPASLGAITGGTDELSQLARVFGQMAVQVQARETHLKQEVAELRIEIDEVKRQKQVSEIVDTEFFSSLQTQAREMRQRKRKQDPPKEESGNQTN